MAQQKQMDWVKIVNMPEQERDAELAQFFKDVAGMDEESRLASLKGMVETAFVQPPDKFRAFTKSRLKAWVKLDDESAKRVNASVDEVMKKMPADMAFRRISVARAVTKELSPEEQQAIRRLSPNLIDPERRVMPTAPTGEERKPRFGFFRR